MVMIRAFRALRPLPKFSTQVAAPPYDVLNWREAHEMARNNPYSFLHVSKPEIDLLDPQVPNAGKDFDFYQRSVYLKGAANLQKMISDKIFFQDSVPGLYFYQQRMGSHTQCGITACFSVDEYNRNIIKKHELTRRDKEDDRTRHIQALDAQSEPVFLFYNDGAGVGAGASVAAGGDPIATLMKKHIANHPPEYHFTSDDGIEHTLWVLTDGTLIQTLTGHFAQLKELYIADGHHRSASAARAASDVFESRHFLAVVFPSSQLKIMDYNRLLLSLNNHTEAGLLAKIQEKFDTSNLDGNAVNAVNSVNAIANKEFAMYLGGKWIKLRPKIGTYTTTHPVESLDVSILQNNLLNPLFGITDPRIDKRIDFVGGIRGIGELVKRVDSGEAKVAFKLHPTSIQELIKVADAGSMMPPKSTWFEPKLRSGLFVHTLH
ncbi:MAG: DUF1015 domain-containing protein [Oligoflexia bacterium]|nr:DUF1015 domain-containing protein [Oligoflexia bacterium]